jgi:hypothetical protein
MIYKHLNLLKLLAMVKLNAFCLIFIKIKGASMRKLKVRYEE